jgi:hypothetical protein
MIHPLRFAPVVICLPLLGCASDLPTLVHDTSVDPGYYVEGNQVLDKNHQPHIFHGVARPTMEWSTSGENISKDDFHIMAGWKANVARIGLNQDFWLHPTAGEGYQRNVLQAVEWAKQANLDVILDLHWSDRGDTAVKPDQQAMADQNSLTFWTSVAKAYKDDGRVLFELYNEPKNISWDAWLNGGTVVDNYYDSATKTSQTVTFTAVGMQQLYNAIRATGAQNIVIAGGISWAYDLTGVATHRIQGNNIMYASHPYDYGDKQPADWDRAWGFLTESAPVIITEFGSTKDTCPTDYSSQLIDYADTHGASWTAWAWYVNGCTFPSLIVDWYGSPSPTGKVVKAALAGYADGTRVVTLPVSQPHADAAVKDAANLDLRGLETQPLDSASGLDLQTIDLSGSDDAHGTGG